MAILHLQQVHNFVQKTLDLLFPPACALCKYPGGILCPRCQKDLCSQENYLRCTQCHDKLAENGICQACRFHPLKLNGLRAYSNHQGILRQCIHALKYEGQTELAQPLGELLAHTYQKYNMQADFLLPLPLHTIRQKQRGYNHATLLAQVCGKQLGIPVYENLVIRHKATDAQVGLNSRQRRENIAGAFSLVSTVTTRTIFKRSIIVIDDVCTTGATLEACTETLFRAGAQNVWGLVLAR